MAEGLFKIFSETAFDAIWHWFVEFDLRDRIMQRPKKKAYLARYARIPWHAWEDRPAMEVDRAVQAISEVLQQENEAAKVTEDL